MIGTFTTPTIANTALARSARWTSSMADRNPMYPRYRKSRISSDVRRGSHSQYVPHIGAPHKEPVTRAHSVKDAPIGAQLAATACETFMRQIKPIAAETAIVVYTINDIHAVGACT